METMIVVSMLAVFGGFAALFVWAQRSSRQRSAMIAAFSRVRGFTYEAEVAKGSIPPFGRHLCFFGGVRRLSDVVRGEHRRVRFWFADAHTGRKNDSINSFVAVAVEGDHPEI